MFGGADALFEHCTLRTVDNGLAHSWVTAPSGAAQGLGFVFWDCDFVSDCPAGSVYLGRPWRPTGKTAVLDCRLGSHIAPEGFAGWNDRTDTALAGFAEAGSTGAGAAPAPGLGRRRPRLPRPLCCCAPPGRSSAAMETMERITE
ncbi:MAG: pectinesterase family protein [Faecalibacterium prausnitzii]